MINGFYAARSGAIASQQNLNIISNNMANVSTAGFKSQEAGFTDLLYTQVVSGNSVAEDLQNGNGVRLSTARRNNTQGTLEQTGLVLDAALSGTGYFAVQNPAGEISYTRQGNFSASREAGGLFLVTASGDYVLDDRLQRIALPDPVSAAVFRAPSDGPEAGGIRIGIFSFGNPDALLPDGNGKFTATEASGAAQVDEITTLSQGYLERSNVDLSNEMADLILAQRGFQFSANLIRTADEMEQTANNLR